MRDAVRAYGIRRMMMHCAAAVTMTVVAGTSVATSSIAADLYNDGYKPRPQAGSPYDDPRYAELYGPDKRYPSHRYEVPEGVPDRRAYDRRNGDIYYDRYGNKVDRPYGYDGPRDQHRYDRYEDRRDYSGRRRYAPWGDRYSERQWHRRWRSGYLFSENCVPRRLVLRRLRHDGWYNFHDLRLRGPRATVGADNENGGSYRLVIDRCSGSVVKARRLDYRHTGYSGRYNGHGRDYRAYK